MKKGEIHYHMNESYETNSESQQSIAEIVIQELVSMLQNCDKVNSINVTDITCGPGNVTEYLLTALQQLLPDTQINMTGLDYTPANIAEIQSRN